MLDAIRSLLPTLAASLSVSETNPLCRHGTIVFDSSRYVENSSTSFFLRMDTDCGFLSLKPEARAQSVELRKLVDSFHCQ
eukprot:1405989-Rhodomonas_salina.1